jgi:transcriptional regulator with XRE-family HTH domain
MSDPGFVGDVSGRIRAARDRLGITQVQAAKRCQISTASWNDMETGKREPTLDRMWGIAVLLGIDPHELDPRLASTGKPRKR